MNLTMTFKHMEASEAIKHYTREKSGKLAKYFDGKISVSWNFGVEKMEHIAHCHLVGNHMDYFGEASTEEMHQSIDLAIEKIEKQLRRHKEIVKDRLHKHHHAQAEAAADEE